MEMELLERLHRAEKALQSDPHCADAHYNRGNALQALSRYAQALESYDRALAIRPGDRQALNNRGVALHALNRDEEALASYDRALALRPDYAEAYNNRANALRALGREAEALASCERALAIRPDYPEALCNRATALQDLGRHEEALAGSEQALALRPGYIEALNGRGNALQALGRHIEALAAYDGALAIDPLCVEALVNRGNALQALRRFDAALASYAEALRLEPEDAAAHWNEGLTRLALGDFARGWEKYEWRWRNRALKSAPRETGKPLWLGEREIAGRTVLLHAEQGFGDAIQSIRYAPMLAERGAHVVVACHRLLRELFATVEGVDAVIDPDQPLPSFDCQVPLMSLPLAFRTTLETIPARVPYVSANPDQVAAWRKRLAPYAGQRKIGLAWKGNPQFTRAAAKSCPVQRLEALVRTAGCAFFSLQKGEAAPPAVLDHGRELDTFADTAALMGALDLVITVDTAAAHLAGALGKPVWILLPFAADWRWLLDREDSPWYPTARLIRQPRPGDWESVICAVQSKLGERRSP
jgi:tetratricopeptide (TPR) repeat protein